MTAQEWQRSEGERQLLFTGFLYFLLSSRVRTGLSYPVCTRRDKRGSKKKKMRNRAKLEVGRQKTEWGVAGTTALWDDPTWTCYLNFPPSCRKWFDLVTRLSVSHSNLGGRELCVEAGQITTFGSLCCSGHEATAEFISCLSLSLYYNYHTWESWLDMTSMFHVRLELLVCADSVCVCVRICCRAPLLPLANIRPSGGVPSALEASCTPQHQQLTAHLSAFMKVSSNSWAGCTPALLPCNLGSPHAELGVDGCSWTKTSWGRFVSLLRSLIKGYEALLFSMSYFIVIITVRKRKTNKVALCFQTLFLGLIIFKHLRDWITYNLWIM